MTMRILIFFFIYTLFAMSPTRAATTELGFSEELQKPTMLLAQAKAGNKAQARAAAKAKKQYGGKVLNVKEKKSNDGRTVFKVKLLLESGRIKIVTVEG